jgi:hypothetical protein
MAALTRLPARRAHPLANHKGCAPTKQPRSYTARLGYAATEGDLTAFKKSLTKYPGLAYIPRHSSG